MDKEFEPRPTGAAAALDQVKRSIYSDLQYVSLQLEGKTYGGWYRLLADGRMELLALANMHWERRPEKTPTEQARGMLADFVRSSQGLQKGDDSSAGAPSADTDSTLGGLLYADASKERIQETDWVALLKAIGAGDYFALDALFDRTHHIVYTLLIRLTGERELAEELTLRVFQDVWRQAAQFDPAEGSVLAWLMNQSRLRAIEWLESARLPARADKAARGRSLRDAQTGLSADESELIEGAYFSKRTCEDLATPERSTETVKQHIHTGLLKLQQRLRSGSDGE